VYAKFQQEDRIPMPHLEMPKRQSTFQEVETGFSAEKVIEEARRCMECGCRDAHECKLRDYATDFGSSAETYAGAHRDFELDESHDSIVYESHKCIQCGTCVRLTEEEIGSHAMGFVGRGFASRVKPALDVAMALVGHDGLEVIVENCPVGALTLKSDSVATLKPKFERPKGA